MTQFALKIRNLSKTYGNGFEALKGVDLNVEHGDFFALLGPNGAGKSTIIRIICSLTNKSAGNVEIYGTDIDKNFSKAKSYLGIVPQEFNFSVFETPLQIVTNTAGFYGMEKKLAIEQAEFVLKKLDLWSKRNDQSRGLSGGMKRRLMIARALVHQPRLLILDEPTAGVDIEIRRSMWEFLEQINADGTTIILTTHYLEEAENLCRNIAIIDNGEIVKNTSMKKLLSTLNTETFVLDLTQPLKQLPAFKNFHAHARDETTIELTMEKDKAINTIFMELSEHNIIVSSMRNKSNRLEELFMNLVTNNLSSANGQGIANNE